MDTKQPKVRRRVKRKRLRKVGLFSEVRRKPSRRFVWAYLLGCVYLLAIATTSSWPESLWGIATLVTMAPAWLVLMPYLLVAFVALLRRPLWGVFVVIAGIPLVMLAMNFQFPDKANGNNGRQVRVVTVNLGNSKVDVETLRKFVERRHVDLLVLQEVNAGYETKEALLGIFHGDCSGHLCLVSPHPIERQKSVNRRNFDEWGVYSTLYEVDVHGHILAVANVHMRTPRSGIQALIDLDLFWYSEISDAVRMQSAESATVQAMVSNVSKPLIVAGDFNMTSTHPVFHRDWGRYQHVFEAAGLGLGYTKFTRWHGVRIDHILTSPNDWAVEQAIVAPSFGGDHRPLIVDLKLINAG